MPIVTTEARDTHEIPMQDAGEHIPKDHPLISVDERCEGGFVVRPSCELGAACVDFEQKNIVCTRKLTIQRGERAAKYQTYKSFP